MEYSINTPKEIQRKNMEINSLYDEGNFHLCSGKYEEAIKYYDRILKLTPYSKTALGYKGFALLKLNKRKEAVNCYEMALNC
ncbi:MAG TPA: tetratricopeptide repeat protein [Nitrosopumilaceae archaeon]|nr:tetratricopeptide repeat protein [Nitrosopumilaceae archaeon]